MPERPCEWNRGKRAATKVTYPSVDIGPGALLGCSGGDNVILDGVERHAFQGRAEIRIRIHVTVAVCGRRNGRTDGFCGGMVGL